MPNAEQSRAQFPLSTPLVWLLAIAAGATVANNYYSQAYLAQLMTDFSLGPSGAAAIPVFTQLGNACGILFIAPVGDRVERKRLILATLVLLTIAQVVVALAGSDMVLVTASISVGLFATVTQQIVPLGMHLAPPEHRGATLGRITSGILIGILLARAASGIVSDSWGWRAVPWCAAGLMLILTGALWLWLPRATPTTDLGYRQLIFSIWTLWRAHPSLRRSVGVQSLIFAAFMAFWGNVALLLVEPRYGQAGTAVGLLALVGVLGAFVAAMAGSLADRRGPGTVVALGAGLTAVSFAILAVKPGFVGLIAGVLVLDAGVQASQIANQSRVYALDPGAKSRLNTIFMATMIVGGAIGAYLGSVAYDLFGWAGTCAFAAGSATAAFLLALRPQPAI